MVNVQRRLERWRGSTGRSKLQLAAASGTSAVVAAPLRRCRWSATQLPATYLATVHFEKIKSAAISVIEKRLVNLCYRQTPIVGRCIEKSARYGARPRIPRSQHEKKGMGQNFSLIRSYVKRRSAAPPVVVQLEFKPKLAIKKDSSLRSE